MEMQSRFGKIYGSHPRALFKCNHQPQFCLKRLKSVNFFIEGEYKWNVNLINQIFWVEEVKIITKIPLSKSGREDKLYWGGNKKCLFSIRSAYHLAQQLQRAAIGETSFGQEDENIWTRTWQLQISSKVKKILWRTLTNILPTRTNLLTKKVNCEGIYPFCKNEVETIIHLIWNCLASQDIWS